VTFPAGFPRYPTAARAEDPVRTRVGLVRWFGAFSPRAVEFASPLPPDECSRRLRAATIAKRPTLRQLVTARATSPLEGDVGPDRIRVARPPRGRREQLWFEGAISPAPHGGSVLRGSVGLPASVLVTYKIASGLLALVVVVMTVAGVGSTVARIAPGPGELVVPGALTAFYLFAWWNIASQIRPEGERLVRALAAIVGATNDPWIPAGDPQGP
jgi:hypothetical protein